MAKRDPWEILGVRPGASEDEVHAAYRALARKWHPDRHPDDPSAADRFREIREAYGRIKDGGGDADFKLDGFTRSEVDRGAVRQDVSNVVSSLFGERSSPSPAAAPSFDPTPAGGGRTMAPGTVRVPFVAAILGGVHTLDVRTEAHGPPRRLKVTLPAGLRSEEQLRIDGAVVSAEVEAHAYFRRESDDVVIDVPLTTPEIALGASVRVPTLTGMVEVRFPAGSRPGRKLRLRGKGVPERGDQICVVTLAVPDGASSAVRRALEALEAADDRSPRPWDEPGTRTAAGR